MKGDVALIKANKADRWGNLTYIKSARNFNPVMAMAAELTVVEVDEMVELGAIDPGSGGDTRASSSIAWSWWSESMHRTVQTADARADGVARRAGHAAKAPTSISASACRRWSPSYVPKGREVSFTARTAFSASGPTPKPGEEDPDMVNAGKNQTTLVTGGAIVHHADSFLMIRGGHLDVSLLGAFEVSENGDLANWTTEDPQFPPGVGGAMDLAVGAKEIRVLMEHTPRTARRASCKQCPYPLTAPPASSGSTPTSP